MLASEHGAWCTYRNGELVTHKGCVVVHFPNGFAPWVPGEHWQVQWYPSFRCFNSFQEALDWAAGQEFDEIEFPWMWRKLPEERQLCPIFQTEDDGA